MKTQRALHQCAVWLAECLKIGWSRDQLDGLEAIWWRHHDDQGRLMPIPRPPIKEESNGN